MPGGVKLLYFRFFSVGLFFHDHSRITGLRISLTPHYHFHPLHRHLDNSRTITAESSPLRISSSRIRAGNLWFTRRLGFSLFLKINNCNWQNSSFSFSKVHVSPLSPSSNRDNFASKPPSPTIIIRCFPLLDSWRRCT